MSDNFDEIITMMESSTVLIKNSANQSATGFFVTFDDVKLQNKFILITCSHILYIDDNNSIKTEYLDILLRAIDDTTKDKKRVNLILYVTDNIIIDHPDNDEDCTDHTDICGIPIDLSLITNRIRIITNNSNYFTLLSPIHEKYFYKNEILPPCEEIYTMGYPDNLLDITNYVPVNRKGIIATNILYDYMGLSQFLIDCECFQGMSGSPVILYNPVLYRTPAGLQMRARFLLLGMLCAAPKDIQIIKYGDDEIPVDIYRHTGIVIKIKEIFKIKDKLLSLLFP